MKATSIVNKIAEFNYLLYNHRYDIILVAETWLKDYISNGFIDPKGAYCTIHYDRCNTRGDGVVVLSRKLTLLMR